MKFFATAKVTDEIPSGKSEWKKLSEGALENASGIFSQNVGFLNDALRDAIAIWADSARQMPVWPKRDGEDVTAGGGQQAKRRLFERAIWRLRFFSDFKPGSDSKSGTDSKSGKRLQVRNRLQVRKRLHAGACSGLRQSLP